jgi:hypothetical protein
MRVGRYMDMVDHEVNGVEEAVGKESGRCNNGGELGFSVGSLCMRRQVSESRKYTKRKIL